MTVDRSARDRAARRRGRRPIAIGSLGALAALVLAAVGAVTGVSAASPAPAASEPPLPGPINVEARLDLPLPTDAAAGDTIVVGFTTWDRQSKSFAEFGEGFVRLHPARGKAGPVEAMAQSDWPGHFSAEVTVPPGGVGTVDVGFRAQVCEGTTCAPRDVLFALAGVGPPPDAPLGLLLVANFDQPRPPILAGDPIDLVVRIEAVAPWDLEGFGLPATLVAFANRRGGPDLATAELHRTGDRGARPGIGYAGQITLPEPGEVSIQIALPGNGTEDQVLGGIGVTVRGTAVSGTPQPTDLVAAATDGDLRWAIAAGVVALALIGGLVVRRAFADL
jgi:hypothetical protein